MEEAGKCSLCGSILTRFHETNQREYFSCDVCKSVQLHPAFYLSLEKERQRYLLHNNNIADAGYQNFVQPLTDAIVQSFGSEAKGLDFGAGTGPVITELLKQQGYDIHLYDPFFHPFPEVLERQYDFIFSCEVAEHFHQPAKEFALLRSLLKPNGKLFIMTDLFDENIEFGKWYYKNDTTHVIFYHAQTFEWIKSEFSFRGVTVQGRLVIFNS